MGIIRLQRNAMPSGSVLQTIQSTSTSLNQTTGLATPQSTDLSVTITPTKSTNKVLISTCFNGGHSASGNGALFYIYRGSTKIFTHQGDYTQSDNSFGNHDLTFLDSPNTTSAVTYTIYYHVQVVDSVNGDIAYFNTDYGAHTGETATITAMEIAG